MIRRLFLYPPLAFARVGPSPTPCESYEWGENDLSARGTGKTTAVPAETLSVADNGTVTAAVPAEVVFKDAVGFRPVCPFFELHAEWDDEDGTGRGPVTRAVLSRFGLKPADLSWTVDVANLKAFHYTLDDGDRIAARLTLPGNETTRKDLEGTSPAGAAAPLVPPGVRVPLGAVQLTRPTRAFPELRLRFTPGAGHVYGPTNLTERTKVYRLPADRMILNPAASWCRFSLEARTSTLEPTPTGCSPGPRATRASAWSTTSATASSPAACPARRRPWPEYAVGPPNFAPDRRPVVSIADGLADRVDRAAVLDPAYVEENEELTSLEVRDIMERALETMANMNVDVQNDRSRAENAGIARAQGLPPQDAADKTLPPVPPVLGRPLPLTEKGRQPHRRFVALEVFEDMLREQPELLSRRVREPLTTDRYYDMRMPYAMRGSDRHPMHLTRRQYALLEVWARHLRAKAQGGA